MKGRGFALPLAVLYGGAFVAGFNENLVNMALMSIMGEYGVDSVTAQWLVTGYMIVATVVVSCMAFLYRRFKLRALFFAAAGLSLAGSVMGLFANSFALLLAARLVQAVGTGIFIPMMINTVLAVTPKNKLGGFLAIGSCTITFGPAFAPVVCGGLVTAFGWHSIFAVPSLAMALLGALGFFLIENLEDSGEAHLDMPSVALSAVGLVALSFGLAQLTLDAPVAAVALAVAAVTLAAFAVRQLRCAHPLIDLTPVKSISFWPTLLLVVVAMMTTFSLSVLLPLYFEGALGLSAFLSGLVILVPVLANAASTLLGGRLMDKRGEWPLLPVGFGVVLAGLALMAAVSPGMSLGAMFAAAFVTYVGVGLIFSPSQTAGLRTLPPEQHPFGVALSTTFVQIAACLGPSMYIGIMSSAQAAAAVRGASSQVGTAEGFSMAIVVAAGIAAAGFGVAFAYALAARRRAKAARPARHFSGVPVLASIMEGDPYTVSAEAPVAEAMRALVGRKVGGMPVVDGRGRGVGFLSDGDIMRYLADKHSYVTSAYSLIEVANGQDFDERLHELMALPVGAVATDGLVTIEVGSSLKEACALLSQHKLKKVPVVDGGRIVGTLNRSDVLRYAMEAYLEADARKGMPA